MNIEKIRNAADKIILISTIDELPLQNMAKIIASCEIKTKGYYACKIDGVKTLFEAIGGST